MKKLVVSYALMLAALVLPQAAAAQDVLASQADSAPTGPETSVAAPVTAPRPVIGYFSYDRVLHSLAEYDEAEGQIEQLRAQYAAETKRVEDEFNAKYEDFLKEQSSLAPAILQKRQAELQDLIEKNIAFKKEARRLLRSATDDAIAPLRELINTTLQVIAREHGYVLVVNTDADACPYLDPEMADDVEDELISRLNNSYR